MKFRRLLVWSLTPLLASMISLLAVAGPASAAVNDGFSVSTSSGGCGSNEFVDYGPGAPGGGDNDDYVLIHDFCADGHGVRGCVRKLIIDDGIPVSTDYGCRYNGNGLAGAPVVWDPFGNVLPGTTISLRVCLVDGASDPTPFRCSDWEAHTSVDG